VADLELDGNFTKNQQHDPIAHSPQTKARQSLMNTRTSAATLFDKHGSAVSPEG
jgi:hypothetical protein